MAEYFLAYKLCGILSVMSSIKKTMISIIIPVYKAENTIRRCLDSILHQSYEDWEAIVVDDGSPDKAGEICDEYQLMDSRFKVIHQKNGGVCSARNAGLDIARGEYIAFCDSDDYVGKDWLSSFMRDMVGNDVVVAGLTYIKGEKEELFWLENQKTTPSLASDMMSQTESFGYLCTKLFKASIIQEHNIRFNTAFRFLEDEEFICRYWTHIEKVKFIKATEYKYIMPDFNRKYTDIDNYHLYQSLLANASKFIDYDDSVTMRKYTMGVFRSMMLAYERHDYSEGWSRLKRFASLSAKYMRYNKYIKIIRNWNYPLWHPVLIGYCRIKN